MDLINKLKSRKVILVLGGYGYGNVGDEAQLNADLKDLKDNFPNHLIKILTPNPSYTNLEHSGYQVLEAPRVAFFDQGSSNLYNIKFRNSKSIFHSLGNEFYKVLFLIMGLFLMLNARLIKIGFPTIMLRARRSSLLYEIQNAHLVFFEGGGYLTGSTLSRLWDGVFFVRIAKIFNVPVVMSGQTIGDWKSQFNKSIARWAFKLVDYISVRDPKKSMEALEGLGLNKQKFEAICDDALFCEKSDELVPTGDYITYHFHYWGCDRSEEKRRELEKHIQIIRILINEYGKNIQLLSMTPSDEEPINDLLKEINSSQLSFQSHDYDFKKIRGLIGNGGICITMKHHPIIFSLGEQVPVISLSNKPYYLHKNEGALRVFGLQEFNVQMEQSTYLEDIRRLIARIESDKEQLTKKISSTLISKKNQRTHFFEKINNLLEAQ